MRVFLSNREYFYFRVALNVWCGNQHKQILNCDWRPGLCEWRIQVCDRWPGGGPQPSRCSRTVDRPRLDRWTARPVVSALYPLFFCFFFNLAPGIRNVYSCAWCWRFEWFLTQGDLVKIFHFSFFSSHQWYKLKDEKWNILTTSPWVKNRSKRQHHMPEYTLRIPGTTTRPGAKLKNNA